MNGFLEKLQKASENPELIPELEAQVKAGGKGGLLSGEKVKLKEQLVKIRIINI